jgi:hypothetical protein
MTARLTCHGEAVLLQDPDHLICSQSRREQWGRVAGGPNLLQLARSVAMGNPGQQHPQSPTKKPNSDFRNPVLPALPRNSKLAPEAADSPKALRVQAVLQAETAGPLRRTGP